MEIKVIMQPVYLGSEKVWEKEIQLSFYDDMEEAVFSISGEFSTKLVDKKETKDIWNRFFHLDFQKLITEGGEETFADSNCVMVELRTGNNCITITLENPNIEQYSKKNMSESIKALQIIKELCYFVNYDEFLEGWF